MDEQNLNQENNILEPLHKQNDAEVCGTKLYNFRRPDKFSKDHLKGILDTHKEYAHQLSGVLTSYLRMPIETAIVSIDQITYEDFIKSMPNNMTFGSFEFAPLGQALVGLSYEVLTSVVNRMLGGDGSSEIDNREFTDVEDALAKKFIEKMVKTLENVWKELLPIQCASVKLNAPLGEIANPNEIVVLMMLEVQLNAEKFGLINICLPYPMLETVLEKFANQHIYRFKGNVATAEEQEQLINKINPSMVDVAVNFGKVDISLQNLLNLKVGDIIKLNKTTDDLVMQVNNNNKFYVQAGRLNDKLSVKITERYTETA